MNIPIQGQFTTDDFKKAFALHLATPRRLAALIVIVLIVLVQITFIKADNFTSGFLSSLPFLLMATMFSYPLLLPRMQAEKMKDSPLLQHPITGQVSDNGIHWIAEDGEMDFSWDVITQYRSASDIVLLYQESGSFIPFPRHLYTNDDDWQAFSQSIRQEIPQKKDRRTQILFAIVSIFVIAIAIINIAALFPQ